MDKVIYYCIVREDGKCDSLSRSSTRAGQLLFYWAIAYPTRKYTIQERSGVMHVDGSITWDKDYNFRPYANIP